MDTDITTRRNPYAVLGTDISGARDSAEAIAHAGLDWDVDQVPMTNMSVLTDEGVVMTGMPDRTLLMRSDNQQGLGVVGGRYRPLSNTAAFSLADDIAAAGGRFGWAGELDGGRKTFMVLTLPDAQIDLSQREARVGDILDVSAALVCDHAGSGSFTADITVTRLVCTNGMTVRVPRAQGADSVRIRHTATAEARIEAARAVMREAVRYSTAYAAVADELACTPMRHEQFTAYIDDLFPEPGEKEKAAHTRWEKRRAELIGLWRSAATNDAGRDTRWAAFNAVTEWLTWGAPLRQTGEDLATTRALRQIGNTAAGEVRQRAFTALTRDGSVLVS